MSRLEGANVSVVVACTSERLLSATSLYGRCWPDADRSSTVAVPPWADLAIFREQTQRVGVSCCRKRRQRRRSPRIGI